MRRCAWVRWALGMLVVAVPTTLSALSWGKTYRVETREKLVDVATYLAPGDIVEVVAGPTYGGGFRFWKSGTAEQPITIRGIKVDGQRPVFTGARDTIEAGGDHYVFESIEITGGEYRCFFHLGHDLVLHDMLIHHCPKHGLLSADSDSGSITVQFSEFHHSGEGERHHQLYVTSDQRKHPNAVFRLQHCYIHDGIGGNNVKSRAARNEIYFNWIEGAHFHELELIGPDVGDPPDLREDSDIVGNVLRKTNAGYATRIGGDGTMDTNGRYRFVNNTILVPEEHRPPFRFFDGLESVEMHNNVIYRAGGGPIRMVQDEHVKWTGGKPLISGSNNVVTPGSTGVPAGWTGTIEAADPKFVDLAAFDLRPAPGSPLIDAGTTDQPSPPGAPFPSPLTKVDSEPPQRRIGQKGERQSDGKIDIGAFEGGFEAKSTGLPAPLPSTSGRTAPSAQVQPVSPRVAPPPTSRCSCEVAGQPTRVPSPWWALGLFGALLRRRREA